MKSEELRMKNWLTRTARAQFFILHSSFFIFAFSFFTSLSAQDVVPVQMVNGDTLFLSNCHVKRNQINMVDAGASNTGFDGWAVVDMTDRMGWVTGSWNSNAPNAYVDVWDGTRLIKHCTTSTPFYDTVFDGTLIIHVHTPSHDSTISSNLNVLWYTDSLSSYCHGPHRMTIHSISKHSAIVNWGTEIDSVLLDYGNGVSLVRNKNYIVLNGLDSVTHYTVTICAWRDRDMECCPLTDTFTTTLVSPPYCIDVTDLESPFVTCASGDSESPLDSIGIVIGRHTIMTDPNATDTNTGGLLHVVPPGHSSALRLGNQLCGAEGEGIICQMTVDTNIYDILLLKYAAVLQDPDHLPQSQPRFSFMLYDDNMQAVDASCGAVDFVANTELGWNRAGGINLWKDWTVTGFNLSPYHGRTLNVVFTTRDCVGGAHYGYAYLVTDCFRKGLSSPQCGEDPPSTLTAPPGFLYEWYTSNDTARIVSTSQTVQVDEPGATYTCRMSYVENPECQIVISVFAGSRFPLADFDYSVYTSDCRHFNVAFENLSTVSPDGVTPSPTGELCDGAWWDFGNGQTSSEYNPIAHYDTSGTYTVTLISTISGGDCQDTMTVDITLPTYHLYEDHYTVCDSMTWWRTGETFYADTVGPVDLHPAADGCDTLYLLHLNVNRTPPGEFARDTSCWTTPYTWRGQTISDVLDTLTVIRLTDTLLNIHGCDSVIGIDVLRIPQYHVDFDADADCHIKQYRLEALSDAPCHTWTSNPIDPALQGHATDSVLTLSPTVATTYTYHAQPFPFDYCPTDRSISLLPVEFPEAKLRLSPQYMTLDAMSYHASDLGPYDQTRSWIMTEYLDGVPFNTLRPLPAPTAHCTLTSVVDSVVVELDVSNGYCHDTARGSIPLVRSNVFAPNIFTPDRNDNNLFRIIALGVSDVELDIYNRQGLIMFHADNLDTPWDGTRDGRPCEQGAYTWRLRYWADDNRIHKQETIGTVVLIR